MKNYFVVGLVIFLIALSSLGVFWGVNIYITEENAKNWPTTIAIVKESRVIESKSKSGVGYCPEWHYEFYLNSKKYISSRNAFGFFSCSNSRKKAELELNSHPIGSEVQVIYNPDDPKHAALQLSSSSSVYWMLILVGGLCVLGGVMILTILFKSRTNRGA
ncbi:MAG: DUF3592 domain-containing protein [Methylococcales bacterium]|nr:DUF3592 domain-containing protein [Methylococcaceae bacterium]